MQGEMQSRANKAGLSALEMLVSQDALLNLKCLSPTAAGPRLTAFGRSLPDACRPPS
jgi:hypothetical protein